MPVSILAMLYVIGICYAGHSVCVILNIKIALRATLLIVLQPRYRDSIFTAKDNSCVAALSWLQAFRISSPFYGVGWRDVEGIGHSPVHGIASVLVPCAISGCRYYAWKPMFIGYLAIACFMTFPDCSLCSHLAGYTNRSAETGIERRGR